MKVETRVVLSEKELDLIENFGELMATICREIDCSNKCPLNYKKDVQKCGIYETTNLISHLKKNTYVKLDPTLD